MNTIHVFCARLSALLFVLLFCSTALAGASKIEICHIPPDDPENAHTISIRDKAMNAHMNHGDFDGDCGDIPEPPNEIFCPCFSADVLQAFADNGGVADCSSGTEDNEFVFYAGAFACAGDGSGMGCLDANPDPDEVLACAIQTADGTIAFKNLSDEVIVLCKSNILSTCL